MVKYPYERAMKSLKKYLKNVKKNFRVDKSILFGSRARLDYFLDSDIDLIILSRDFENINPRKNLQSLDWSIYWRFFLVLQNPTQTPYFSVGYKTKDFVIFRERMSRLLEWWNESIDLEVIRYTPEEIEKKKQIGIVRQAIKEGIEL